MTTIPLRFLILYGALLICTSCVSTKFETRSEIVQATNLSYMASYEVSVGDWLVYMASTSFKEEYKEVHLADHYDAIFSKLPALTEGRWDHFVINAFLRKSQDNVSVRLDNDCKDHIIKVIVAKTAWDSIQEYRMMDLPIVGITFEQAMDYLAYKQALVNSCGLKSKDNFRYECFLPSPEQFAIVQTTMDTTNLQGCNMFNYVNSLCADCPNSEKYLQHPVLSRMGREPTYVNAYFPDPFGLYNIKGNVAEMTSEKGVAMGGSCIHYALEAFDGRKQAYVGSAPWLGFRIWYRRISGS